MTIKQFLTRHVEGYLFKDLRTISRIKLRKGQKVGGVGYPFVASILAGMELLGGLVSNSSFDMNPSAGNTYFEDYWNNYFSKHSQRYARYSSAFRKLVRHGIAHTYLTKTGIWIIRGEPSAHLSIFVHSGNHYLVIDVMEFFNDFVDSYNLLVRPIVWNGITSGNVSKGSMQDRLNEMVTAYENQSNSELSNLGVTNNTLPAPIMTAILSNASTSPSTAGTVVTYSGMVNRKP